MGWAQEQSGEQTTVLDTEHILGTDPLLTDATYVLVVDVNLMVGGDTLLLRWYEKVTGTGDTQRGMVLGSLAGEQVNNLWFSVPVINIHGGKFTMEQPDGTVHAYDWSRRAITE